MANQSQATQHKKAKVLLAYPQDVFNDTTINNNIFDANLVNHIELIQDRKIRKALGRTLYKELFDAWVAANQIRADIDDGSLTNTTNYKELYDYVYPALIWWAYADFILPNHYSVTEKGVQKQFDSSANTAEKEEVLHISETVRKNAEFYMEELRAYIDEVFKNDQTFNDESVDEGGYFSGIYIPRHKKCN